MPANPVAAFLLHHREVPTAHVLESIAPSKHLVGPACVSQVTSTTMNWMRKMRVGVMVQRIASRLLTRDAHHRNSGGPVIDHAEAQVTLTAALHATVAVELWMSALEGTNPNLAGLDLR